ncbi:MAG TPA: hypothetical protein VI007_02465 [bacterium]
MLVRMARRTALAGAVVYGVYSAGIRPWKHRWDASPDEREAVLPGDDLVVTPVSMETRAVTITAPPTAVWPWLIQMGYGRAGWYSYGPPGRRGEGGTWHLIPQFEDLQVGSIVPTHPHGGFKVATLEHERGLVLYLDTTIVREQMLATQASNETALRTVPELPEFRASWAFILHPLEADQTRLLERTRITAPAGRLAVLALHRLTGFAIFLLQRKQLIGIKARAEQAWRRHVEGPVESHVA